jgi:predicted PurR-regulated permease PerM
MKQVSRQFELSYKTIVFTVIFLLSLWVVYTIRDILLQVFVALLITAILDPLTTKLLKYGVSRSASILLVYLLAIAMVTFVISAIIPPLIDQTTLFAAGLPTFLQKLPISSDVGSQIVQQVVSQFGSLPSQVAKIIFGLFGNIINVVTVLVFAYYLLSERQNLVVQLAKLIGQKKEEESLRILSVLEHKLGGWARGQLLLMLIIGIFSYVGLLLLGIPYALPLAIIAGLLEVVPYLGPIMSAIPAIVIGFGISPFMGFATVVLYFLVQQFENYFFVPRIMQHSTGVNPVIILLALSIGLRLAGPVGFILAIPVYISVTVLIEELTSSKE